MPGQPDTPVCFRQAYPNCKHCMYTLPYLRYFTHLTRPSFYLWLGMRGTGTQVLEFLEHLGHGRSRDINLPYLKVLNEVNCRRLSHCSFAHPPCLTSLTLATSPCLKKVLFRPTYPYLTRQDASAQALTARLHWVGTLPR